MSGNAQGRVRRTKRARAKANVADEMRHLRCAESQGWLLLPLLLSRRFV